MLLTYRKRYTITIYRIEIEKSLLMILFQLVQSVIELTIENMDCENIFKNYVLSEDTCERLVEIKEKLKENMLLADPLWHIVAGKNENISHESSDEFSTKSEEECNDVITKSNEDFSSTQFYFTQAEKHYNKSNEEQCDSKDIIECMFEELESQNGKININHLKNFTDIEVIEITSKLEKKLSTLGTYNLICAMNSMTLEQRIKYAPIFHNYLLLPKIMALEEPSRLLLSVIVECVQKYPDDIQKLIFIPLLNVDLKDPTIIEVIVKAFEPQRRATLITEYLSNVEKLKLWHLSFLPSLISFKIDPIMSNKLIQLLHEKALDFAQDKNFGKLTLSFIKMNGRFTKEQIALLWEISNVNQTLFKKPIQTVLKTVEYFECESCM